MAYREFQDEEGRSWRVWDTYPRKPLVAPGFENGWLSFETEGETCRLAPVPTDWHQGSVPCLRDLLRAARRLLD